jgi:DNA polymerase-3 subunit chi
VAFHFNVEERLPYTCRLVRKALAAGTRLVITGSPETLKQLDRDLWTFSATEFLPHCGADDPGDMVQKSAVLLADALSELPLRDVLINLGHAVPQGFEQFERVIEVVSLDPDELVPARQRWREYAQSGHKLVRHDLGPRAQA